MASGILPTILLMIGLSGVSVTTVVATMPSHAQKRNVGIYSVVPINPTCTQSIGLGDDKGSIFLMYMSAPQTYSCRTLFSAFTGKTIFASAEELSLESQGACLTLIDGNTVDDPDSITAPKEYQFCNDTLFKFQSTGKYLTIAITMSPDHTKDQISFRLALTPVMSGQVCSDKTFQCDNGDCIPSIMEADGHRNCPDNSDEKNTPTSVPNCGTQLASCSSGQCIARTSECDHFIDCPDTSDERGCVYLCPDTIYDGDRFGCSDGQGCFNEYNRCNGYHACYDATDDKDCDSCDSYGETQDITYCEQTRTCLSTEEICDGIKNCPNGQDEKEDFCHPSIYLYWSNGQLAGLFIGYIIFVSIVVAIVIVVHKKCRKEID